MIDAEGYDGDIIIDFLSNSSLRPLIVLEYISTNADLANLATSFTLAGTIGGTSSATVTTVSNAAGGAERDLFFFCVCSVGSLLPFSSNRRGHLV